MNLPRVVILCGGQGTRIRQHSDGIPKILLVSSGVSLAEIIMKRLAQSGIRTVTLLAGVGGELIKAWAESFESDAISIDVVIEKSPLGTFGAFRDWVHSSWNQSESIAVINGDTLLHYEFPLWHQWFLSTQFDMGIVLMHSKDCSRYGSVCLGVGGRIISYLEKSSVQSGLISSGVYLISRNLLDEIAGGLYESFRSFEEEVIPELVASPDKRVGGIVEPGAIFDIGTPESLLKYQLEGEKVN